MAVLGPPPGGLRTPLSRQQPEESPVIAGRRQELDRARWETLGELYLAIRELPAAARQGHLDSLTAYPPELRREVAAMLAATDAPLGFEERLTGATCLADLPIGTRLGPYRIVGELGRGGMGEVYLAERDDGQFQQQVAVKVMRAGLFATERAARFERERQILARMVHPRIVPLLDGGVTPDGRPYLVMQRIVGEPITTWCDARRLPIGQRLRLFEEVCEAVQAAHANLVIHRDLKPSNVVVGEDGGVRLLDFGVAELVADGDAPHLTSRWMTPERAAPEQLRGEPATTASDCFALGVLLAELLTDQLPAPADQTGDASAGAMGITLPSAITDSAATARRTTPRALRRTLRGDLGAILARATREHPADRYPSAAQLAEDVHRFRCGLPVQARPGTVPYRAWRFFRRHLAASIATVLALASLVAFAMATAIQARQLALQRDRATLEEGRAKEVVRLLVDLFESTSPTADGGDNQPIDAFLDAAVMRFNQLRQQPEVQARMWVVLGRIQHARSNWQQALALTEAGCDQLRRTLGPDSVEVLEATLQLAQIRHDLDQDDDARTTLEALLPDLARVLGDRHSTTLAGRRLLGVVTPGDKGGELLRSVLQQQRAAPDTDPVQLAATLNELARLCDDLREETLAQAYRREAYELVVSARGEADPLALTLLHNLAFRLPDPAERERLQRRLIDLRQGIFGERSAEVANGWNNLGVTLATRGDLSGAETAFRRTAELWRSMVGGDHWRTVNADRNLARTLELQGRYEECLALFDRVSHAFPAERPGRALLDAQRGRALLHAGRVSEAFDALAEASRSQLDQGDPAAGEEIDLGVGAALLVRGRPRDAEAPLRRAAASRSARLGEDDPRTGEVLLHLGRVLALTGGADEARAALQRGLQLVEGWGLAHPDDLAAARAASADLEREDPLGKPSASADR